MSGDYEIDPLISSYLGCFNLVAQFQKDLRQIVLEFNPLHDLPVSLSQAIDSALERQQRLATARISAFKVDCHSLERFLRE